MKWKKISWQDYESLTISYKFIEFLELLNLKSASDFAQSLYEELDEYCEECENIKDDCSCRRYNRDSYYDNYDTDYKYDAWKDSQLEEKYGDK